jgi:pimeloyl-ACP methyl ester carboxylesterase
MGRSMSPDELRPRRIALPDRGGTMAALEMGPVDRPVEVVFSHANGFNARTYRSILAESARRLRILAVDLRGHGASQLPTETEGRTGWEDLGQDLEALLAALDLPDVILAGHSMGATASLLAAAAQPQRVKALALFEPVILSRERSGKPGLLPADSGLARGAARRRSIFEGPDAAVESFVGRGAFKTWSRVQVEDYVAGGLLPQEDGSWTLACAPAWEVSNFRAQSHDPWPALDHGPRPIRMLLAEHGSTAWLGADRGRLAAEDGVRIATIPGATHFLPMERPELVASTLAVLAQT